MASKKSLTMEFDNPTFRPNDVNFTVRLGKKWAPLTIGQTISLAASKKSRKKIQPVKATVVYVLRCFFAHIPQFVLDNEHDPKCKTFNGLYEALVKAYGREKVLARSEVTCVGFIPLNLV